MFYILKDENGKVIAASKEKFSSECEESAENYDVGFDGQLYSESELNSADYLARKAAGEIEKRKDEIRAQRQYEFNKYIDKSVFWYNELTEEQRAEIDEWRQAWKDAPDTFIIPTRPVWLK